MLTTGLMLSLLLRRLLMAASEPKRQPQYVNSNNNPAFIPSPLSEEEVESIAVLKLMVHTGDGI